MIREDDVSGEIGFRDQLVAAHAQAHRDFDRAVMTMSAGALGLSLTFVNDIAGEDPTLVILLGIAWGLFGCSLLAVMVSFLTSQKALLAEIQALDVSDDSVIRGGTYGRWTLRLNLFGALFLVGGVASLIAFVITNLNQ